MDIKELADKLGHPLADIRFRSLDNLRFKLSAGFVTTRQLAAEPTALYHLLKWLSNEERRMDGEVLALLKRIVTDATTTTTLTATTTTTAAPAVSGAATPAAAAAPTNSTHVSSTTVGASAALALHSMGAVHILQLYRARAPASMHELVDSLMSSLLHHFSVAQINANAINIKRQPLSSAKGVMPTATPSTAPPTATGTINATESAANAASAALTAAAEQSPATSAPAVPASSAPMQWHDNPNQLNPQPVVDYGGEYQFMSGTRFVWVPITRADDKYLFEVGLKLDVNHVPTLRSALREFEYLMSTDFPVQVLLHRPHIVKSMCNLLKSSATAPTDVWASNCLRLFVHRLKRCLRFHIDIGFRTPPQPAAGSSLSAPLPPLALMSSAVPDETDEQNFLYPPPAASSPVSESKSGAPTNKHALSSFASSAGSGGGGSDPFPHRQHHHSYHHIPTNSYGAYRSTLFPANYAVQQSAHSIVATALPLLKSKSKLVTLLPLLADVLPLLFTDQSTNESAAEHHSQVWGYLYELSDVLFFYKNAAIRTDPVLLNLVEWTCAILHALPPSPATPQPAAPIAVDAKTGSAVPTVAPVTVRAPPPPPRHLRHLTDQPAPDPCTVLSGDLACVALRVLCAQLSELCTDEAVAATRPEVRTALLALAPRFFPNAQTEYTNARRVLSSVEFATQTKEFKRADIERSMPALHFVAPNVIVPRLLSPLCDQLSALCTLRTDSMTETAKANRRSEEEACISLFLRFLDHPMPDVRQNAYAHVLLALQTAIQQSAKSGGDQSAAVPPFVYLFHRAVLFQIVFYGTIDVTTRTAASASASVGAANRHVSVYAQEILTSLSVLAPKRMATAFLPLYGTLALYATQLPALNALLSLLPPVAKQTASGDRAITIAAPPLQVLAANVRSLFHIEKSIRTAACGAIHEFIRRIFEASIGAVAASTTSTSPALGTYHTDQTRRVLTATFDTITRIDDPFASHLVLAAAASSQAGASGAKAGSSGPIPSRIAAASQHSKFFQSKDVVDTVAIVTNSDLEWDLRASAAEQLCVLMNDSRFQPLLYSYTEREAASGAGAVSSLSAQSSSSLIRVLLDFVSSYGANFAFDAGHHPLSTAQRQQSAHGIRNADANALAATLAASRVAFLRPALRLLSTYFTYSYLTRHKPAYLNRVSGAPIGHGDSDSTVAGLTPATAIDNRYSFLDDDDANERERAAAERRQHRIHPLAAIQLIIPYAFHSDADVRLYAAELCSLLAFPILLTAEAATTQFQAQNPPRASSSAASTAVVLSNGVRSSFLLPVSCVGWLSGSPPSPIAAATTGGSGNGPAPPAADEKAAVVPAAAVEYDNVNTFSPAVVHMIHDYLLLQTNPPANSTASSALPTQSTAARVASGVSTAHAHATDVIRYYLSAVAQSTSHDACLAAVRRLRAVCVHTTVAPAGAVTVSGSIYRRALLQSNWMTVLHKFLWVDPQSSEDDDLFVSLLQFLPFLFHAPEAATGVSCVNTFTYLLSYVSDKLVPLLYRAQLAHVTATAAGLNTASGEPAQAVSWYQPAPADEHTRAGMRVIVRHAIVTFIGRFILFYSTRPMRGIRIVPATYATKHTRVVAGAATATASDSKSPSASGASGSTGAAVATPAAVDNKQSAGASTNPVTAAAQQQFLHPHAQSPATNTATAAIADSNAELTSTALMNHLCGHSALLPVLLFEISESTHASVQTSALRVVSILTNPRLRAPLHTPAVLAAGGGSSNAAAAALLEYRSAFVRATVAVCGVRRAPNTFRGATAIRVGLQTLLNLNTPIQSLVPVSGAAAAAVSPPVHISDWLALDSFEWLLRCCVDRESLIRCTALQVLSTLLPALSSGGAPPLSTSAGGDAGPTADDALRLWKAHHLLLQWPLMFVGITQQNWLSTPVTAPPKSRDETIPILPRGAPFEPASTETGATTQSAGDSKGVAVAASVLPSASDREREAAAARERLVALSVGMINCSATQASALAVLSQVFACYMEYGLQPAVPRVPKLPIPVPSLGDDEPNDPRGVLDDTKERRAIAVGDGVPEEDEDGESQAQAVDSKSDSDSKGAASSKRRKSVQFSIDVERDMSWCVQWTPAFISLVPALLAHPSACPIYFVRLLACIKNTLLFPATRTAMFHVLLRPDVFTSFLRLLDYEQLTKRVQQQTKALNFHIATANSASASAAASSPESAALRAVGDCEYFSDADVDMAQSPNANATANAFLPIREWQSASAAAYTEACVLVGAEGFAILLLLMTAEMEFRSANGASAQPKPNPLNPSPSQTLYSSLPALLHIALDSLVFQTHYSTAAASESEAAAAVVRRTFTRSQILLFQSIFPFLDSLIHMSPHTFRRMLFEHDLLRSHSRDVFCPSPILFILHLILASQRPAASTKSSTGAVAPAVDMSLVRLVCTFLESLIAITPVQPRTQSQLLQSDDDDAAADGETDEKAHRRPKTAPARASNTGEDKENDRPSGSERKSPPSQPPASKRLITTLQPKPVPQRQSIADTKSDAPRAAGAVAKPAASDALSAPLPRDEASELGCSLFALIVDWYADEKVLLTATPATADGSGGSDESIAEQRISVCRAMSALLAVHPPLKVRLMKPEIDIGGWLLRQIHDIYSLLCLQQISAAAPDAAAAPAAAAAAASQSATASLRRHMLITLNLLRNLLFDAPSSVKRSLLARGLVYSTLNKIWPLCAATAGAGAGALLDEVLTVILNLVANCNAAKQSLSPPNPSALFASTSSILHKAATPGASSGGSSGASKGESGTGGNSILQKLIALLSQRTTKLPVLRTALRIVQSLAVEPHMASLLNKSGLVSSSVDRLEGMYKLKQFERLHVWLEFVACVAFTADGQTALMRLIVPNRLDFFIDLVVCPYAQLSNTAVRYARSAAALLLFRNLAFLPTAKVPLLSNERFLPAVLGELIRSERDEHRILSAAGAAHAPADAAGAAAEEESKDTPAAAALSEAEAAESAEIRAINCQTQLMASSLLFAIVYNNQKARMLVKHRARDTVQLYWDRIEARRMAQVAAATIRDGTAPAEALEAAASSTEIVLSPEHAQISESIRALLKLITA